MMALIFLTAMPRVVKSQVSHGILKRLKVYSLTTDIVLTKVFDLSLAFLAVVLRKFLLDIKIFHSPIYLLCADLLYEETFLVFAGTHFLLKSMLLLISFAFLAQT